jgi:hypothetical protein
VFWQDHQPPHFHAVYSGDEALLSIADATFVAGLPPPRGSSRPEWTELRRSHLLESWTVRTRPRHPSRSRLLPSLGSMSRPARVVDVEHRGDFRLRLTFSDGLVRELDFDGVPEGKLFAPLSDRTLFAQVSVDAVAGTIVWPNGTDLDPDVLRGDHAPASGRSPVVLREYHLRPTG